MEAGYTPLPGCLGLKLGDDDFIETCCLLKRGKVKFERKSAKLYPKKGTCQQ